MTLAPLARTGIESISSLFKSALLALIRQDNLTIEETCIKLDSQPCVIFRQRGGSMKFLSDVEREAFNAAFELSDRTKYVFTYDDKMSALSHHSNIRSYTLQTDVSTHYDGMDISSPTTTVTYMACPVGVMYAANNPELAIFLYASDQPGMGIRPDGRKFAVDDIPYTVSLPALPTPQRT